MLKLGPACVRADCKTSLPCCHTSMSLFISLLHRLQLPWRSTTLCGVVKLDPFEMLGSDRRYHPFCNIAFSDREIIPHNSLWHRVVHLDLSPRHLKELAGR